MFKFEELNTYKDAVSLANKLYRTTKNWPKDEAFGLTNQARRAAVSIALNIAEGSSRSKKDFRHFLGLSRGSCYECVAILTIANEQNYLNKEEFLNLYQELDLLTKKVNALRRAVTDHEQ